jgi:hypothetical protein
MHAERGVLERDRERILELDRNLVAAPAHPQLLEQTTRAHTKRCDPRPFIAFENQAVRSVDPIRAALNRHTIAVVARELGAAALGDRAEEDHRLAAPRV